MERPLILHVDMDAFFASVETRSDPRLAGLPLAVGGGPGNRGVVTTASYPARVFGVKSGMAMAQAVRLCPQILVLPVDPPKYVHESLEVLAVLDRFSPRVEPASIDEAYLELEPVPVSEWERRAAAAGHAVREAVLAARGLSCTVGAAANKLQAKMVSARAKPAGVGVLPPERFAEVFGPSEVGVIPGVGPRTVEFLRGLGIVTVRDLVTAPPERLRRGFGRWEGLLQGHARGEDGCSVVAAGEALPPRSAGHETTFAQDVADPRYLRATVWLLADRVARRLRLHRFTARTVAVRFKVGRSRYSRQRALPEPTDRARVLAVRAWDLLEPARRGRALRLLGVAGMNLTGGSEPALLFEEDRRDRALVRAGDRLRDRFGEGALLPAGVFLREEER